MKSPRSTVVWKGMWDILDDVYETYSWRASMSLMGGVLIYLMTVGSLRTVMGTPLGTGFVADIDRCYLYIPTMWQMEVSKVSSIQPHVRQKLIELPIQ